MPGYRVWLSMVSWPATGWGVGVGAAQLGSWPSEMVTWTVKDWV